MFAQLIEASDSGVRELIARGEIRAGKVGGLLRIPASELVKFTGQKEECPCDYDAGAQEPREGEGSCVRIAHPTGVCVRGSL